MPPVSSSYGEAEERTATMLQASTMKGTKTFRATSGTSEHQSQPQKDLSEGHEATPLVAQAQASRGLSYGHRFEVPAFKL